MKSSMIQLTAVLALVALSSMACAQSNASTSRTTPSASGRQPAASRDNLAALLPWRQIEGLWDEQVMQVDCVTGKILHPIGRGTNLFIAGGALVATNNAPPTVMGVTLGQWVYGSDHKFHATMRLNLFQPPSEMFIAVREMKRDITISNHGNSLAGVVAVQDYLPDGTPSGAPFCATETGTRITSH